MHGGRSLAAHSARQSAPWLAVLASLLILFGLIPVAMAAQATNSADPSDVVIALDFSNSIMSANKVRNAFADALTEIARNVDAHDTDLMSGPATFTFVAFAGKAQDYAGCSKINVLDSARGVTTLSDCFRAMAHQYRLGVKAPIVKKVGTDTNYVAVFKAADKDLPAGSLRPAVVFFTDGNHDVPGVPDKLVQPAAEAAFGHRSPFAFLPVGMGLSPSMQSDLKAGLEQLRDLTTGMTACDGGQTFSWPQVVFSTPAQAGNAVSEALQSVTCTFPVSKPTPTPPPTPAPTPSPTPAQAPATPTAPAVRSENGGVAVSWTAPADQGSAPINRYDVRCRADGGDWTPTEAVPPTATTVSFTGLTNGTRYECQVRAVSAIGASEWVSAIGMPAGGPSAPIALSAQGADGGATILVEPGPDGGSAITNYTFECAPVGTTKWAPAAASAITTTYAVSGLANEMSYTCRAAAVNALGVSPVSPVSNEFLACNGLLQCNGWLVWLLRLLAALLLALLLLWLLNAWANRSRRYIGAQVDGFPDMELGLGPEVGLMFNRDRRGRIVEAVPTSVDPDIRIRYHGGGSFTVTGAGERVPFKAGQPDSVADANGETHQLILRAARRPQSDGAIYDLN